MRNTMPLFTLARCLVLGTLLVLGTPALAQTDPLPFWNDGPAKKAIVEFVQVTTTPGSTKFVSRVTARAGACGGGRVGERPRLRRLAGAQPGQFSRQGRCRRGALRLVPEARKADALPER